MWGLLLHAFLYFLPEIPALRFRAPTRNFRRHRPPHAAEGASRAISIPDLSTPNYYRNVPILKNTGKP